MATTKNINRPSKNNMHIDLPQSMHMPPPPPPQKKILEVEVAALGNFYRNAVVKTAQVYDFYAKTRKLGINQHAPQPPRSLTGSLGREIEKYDQLCDAIESRLQRATAVLERDLERAEARLKAAQAAEPQKASTPDPGTVPSSPTQTLKSMEHSPIQSAASGRRPSAISLSSLQRPSFPHKLDLTSLRLNPEDLITLSATGGLASPVTLAPRSARPTTANELPPDLMAALASSEANASATGVEIDLTLDPDAPSTLLSAANLEAGGLGSSADKPIELDLDIDMSDMQEMSSIFGEDANTDVEVLFSPPDTEAGPQKTDATMDILNEFSSTVDTSDTAGNNIFSSMEGQGTENNLGVPSASSAPSPGTLLASFNQAASGNGSADNISGADIPFDINSIDLDSIDHNFLMASGSDINLMEELFQVDGGTAGSGTEGNKEG